MFIIKSLLLSINAKHCHTAPAGRVLKNICLAEKLEVSFFETTLQQPLFEICSEVMRHEPDILVVGVYIWNVELVFKLVEMLKKLRPLCAIALAGPEVSYTPREFLKSEFVDYVLCGECEEILPAFIKNLEKNLTDSMPIGIQSKSFTDPYAYAVADFSDFHLDYYSDEEISSGQLLYFETSRGCPYRCSYCLSSTQQGVRFMDSDKAIAALLRLGKGHGIVKLLDRTFNADKARALKIWRALAASDNGATYHFEICANLLDEEAIAFLATVPKGNFQFEIGIQSANPTTLESIRRYTDTEKELEKIAKLKKTHNIHLHLDLIAGLPYENYACFQRSFDCVYPNAHVLQLGFLKVLKGTHIAGQIDEFAYQFASFPPYEILQNQFLSFADIRKLKQVERALELLSNSEKFAYSLPQLLKSCTPFALFLDFGCFLEHRDNFSQKDLFHIFYEFVEKMQLCDDEFREYFKIDYVFANRGALPPYLRRPVEEDFRNAVFRFFRNHALLYEALPHLSAYSPKEIEKNVDVCTFIFRENTKKILLFDRKYGKIVDITKYLGGLN